MARFKILFIITLSEVGGAQKVVYHLAAGLPPEQFDITVACAPGGELVGWLKDLSRGVRVVEIPELKRNISPLKDLQAFRKLYSLINRGSFDIVHCHSSKAGFLGRLAARLAGVPKIFFTVHGWGINEYQSWPVRFFYTWAERLAGAVSTKVVCVSESDRDKGRRLRLAAPDKLKVIYNGMPEPEKRVGALRGELNLQEEGIVIGTVARLAHQKAPLFLLEVAGQMINRSTNGPGGGRVYFVLAGDGPLKSGCEEFIKNKGLEGRVFLLGSREEAAALISDFDVFVLFSRWEGLPLTIIEAMLAGRPVVASTVGGVGELVVNGVTGLLIEELDAAAAERALWEVLSDPARRLQMGRKGRQRAADMFRVDKMVANYLELYISDQ